jgi:hypothetical protein
MKLCRNINRSVWQLLGLEKFKMAAVAMVTTVQKSSDLGGIWFPSRFLCWELISMVWEPYYVPLCRNIHRSMWQLLGLNKFKMAAVAMVTKVQNGRQIQKSSDLGEI